MFVGMSSLETDCRYKTDFFPQKRFKALKIFFFLVKWREECILLVPWEGTQPPVLESEKLNNIVS